jgi:hypothetical protein
MSVTFQEFLLNIRSGGKLDEAVFFGLINETHESLSEKLISGDVMSSSYARAIHAIIGFKSPSEGVGAIISVITDEDAKLCLLSSLGSALSQKKFINDEFNSYIAQWSDVLTNAGFLDKSLVAHKSYTRSVSVSPILLRAIEIKACMNDPVWIAIGKTLCEQLSMPRYFGIMNSMKVVMRNLSEVNKGQLTQWFRAKIESQGDRAVIDKCELETKTVKASITYSAKQSSLSSPQYPFASMYVMMHVLSICNDKIDAYFERSQGKQSLLTLKLYLDLCDMSPMDFMTSRTLPSKLHTAILRLLSS